MTIDPNHKDIRVTLVVTQPWYADKEPVHQDCSDKLSSVIDRIEASGRRLIGIEVTPHNDHNVVHTLVHIPNPNRP